MMPTAVYLGCRAATPRLAPLSSLQLARRLSTASLAAAASAVATAAFQCGQRPLQGRRRAVSERIGEAPAARRPNADAQIFLGLPAALPVSRSGGGEWRSAQRPHSRAVISHAKSAARRRRSLRHGCRQFWQVLHQRRVYTIIYNRCRCSSDATPDSPAV